MSDQLGPINKDVEATVLGSVLFDQACLSQVADLLRAEVFGAEEHQLIWGAIAKLYRERDPIDIVTVTNVLRSEGKLGSVGGALYVAQLVNRVASTAHVYHHALILVELFLRREQIRIGRSMVDRAMLDTHDAFETLADTGSQVRGLMELGQRSAQPMTDIMPQVVDVRAVDRGIPFFFDALDNLIRIEPGVPTVIGARPGMGKTAFMLSSAWRQAKAGHRPYILSLEMKGVGLARRLVASQTGVPVWDIKRGVVTEEQMETMAKWYVEHGDAVRRMIVDEVSTLTVSSLAARLERAKRVDGIDMVWIDYIGLLQPSERKTSAYERMTAVSNELRIVCKDLDLPVVELCQLSRPPKGSAVTPPRLTDLRDTGAIEQDAEAVLFLHRPKYYDENAGDEIEVIIAKHRDGPDGRVELRFNPDRVAVEDHYPSFTQPQGLPPRLTMTNDDDAPF